MRPTYLRALRKARAQTQAMALHPGQGVSDIMDISSDLNTERLAPVVTALVTGAGTGTAYQNPAHDHSSKKRDAPCEMSGEYAGPLPDAKREDNGDHADKTVNLDDFWNAKRGSLGIHPQEGGTLLVDTPDGVTRLVEPCYEGSITGIPPFPHEYIADFLREWKPNCPQAQAWVKAHEASKAARIEAAQKQKEQVQKKKGHAQSDESSGEEAAKKALRMRFGNNKRRFRRAMAKARAATAQKATREKREEKDKAAAPVPRRSTMDLSAVRSALEAAKASDSHTDEEFELTIPTKTPQERLDETISERELHASVIDSLDKAQDRLRKTMFGDNPPPKPSNDDFPKYPAGGFPTTEEERNFHATIVSRINQAVGRVYESQQSLLKTMYDNGFVPHPSKSDSSSPEPMGLRRTPEGVKAMERKREIHPDSSARVKGKHDMLQKATFGDEDISTVNFNERNF